MKRLIKTKKMSDLTFSVQGQSNSATKFTAKARQFSLIIDEPDPL